MPPWVKWIPLAVLTLWVSLHFLRLGWIAANLSETDVIDIYANQYLEDRRRDGTGEGAQKSDCLAYPGEIRGIWFVVACGPKPFDAARHYEYHVNRFGALQFSGGPNLAPEI
ncbi:hypothetical protein [Pseudoprimorskyibacter insulae]|uniref:Uncharacterized protein n=1 Tax=Pseudoprimorskyibacter insulae TaxID=1695997 RepID=A0A2R8AWZ0_9RHOB|nr:hypothetical protein [Pseudoprimorskyibacter insulae]SPF80565.1 hypothetical protein PRI8871_02375 [Pseudoprimorskyibacter insulae]